VQIEKKRGRKRRDREKITFWAIEFSASLRLLLYLSPNIDIRTKSKEEWGNVERDARIIFQ
jgi:hypothetical protein